MTSSVEQVKAGIWTREEWIERFSSGPDWASSEPDKHLVKLADRLFEGKENNKVYFPCCGNSFDMKWAYDLGYEIVGTDCIPAALKDFLENKAKVKYTEEKIDSIDGTLFKSEDNRIHLYCCDVTKFSGSIEGQCGAIVDSAALPAINKEDLPKYVKHLVSMMTPNCRTILFTTEYDESIYPGPPHSVPQSVVQGLFGEDFNYEHLFSYDMMAEMEEFGECLGHEEQSSSSQQPQSDSNQTSDKNSEKAQKDEVFNQMMSIKSMMGTYTLITRKK